jgi:hypothetical protein
MRVRCTRLIATTGPRRGQPIESVPGLAVGDEVPVLSILADPPAPWPILLQLLVDGGPSWWPAEMFITTSSRIASNWTIQVWDDGSIHIAPDAWLRPGFWEEFFNNQRLGPAADTFRRELEVILRES